MPEVLPTHQEVDDMLLGTTLHHILADGEVVTVVALLALVALEVLLRATGFARPDDTALDLDDR